MAKINRIKKLLVIPTLVSTLALTGCASKEKQKEITTEVTTEATTEATTEEITTEFNISSEYEELAEISYNEYNDFYSGIGLEKDDVLRVVKFINDDVSDMTDDEIIETTTNIRKILYSDQLQSKARAAQADVIFDEPLAQAPSLVSFVENEDIKQELVKFESLRTNVVNELETVGKVSESTKQELIDLAIDVHYDAYGSNYEIYKVESSLGQCYVQNEWREQLFNLVVVVTGQTEISNDRSKGNMIQIAPKTVEESDLLNLYMAYGNDMPDDKKQAALDLVNRLVWTQFSNENTNIINKLLSGQKVNEDGLEISDEDCTSSIKSELKESYKAKKELLLSAYNFDENTYKYIHRA